MEQATRLVAARHLADILRATRKSLECRCPDHQRVLPTASGRANRAIQGRTQIALAERLMQAFNGTASKKLRAQVWIGNRCDKYNRNFQFATGYFRLQLRARHALHGHVQYQTPGADKRIGIEKLLPGSKSSRCEAERTQEIRQRLTYRHIVIDH
jgi:hypothetical protein